LGFVERLCLAHGAIPSKHNHLLQITVKSEVSDQLGRLASEIDDARQDKAGNEDSFNNDQDNGLSANIKDRSE
jgi:hypothetical protein